MANIIGEMDEIMRTKTLFTGSAVAIITPFDENGIDFQAFERLIEFQIENQTSAIVVCGTTGEPSTLSWDERQALVKFCIQKVNGRVPVIVGTGCNNTAEAVKLSKNAQDLGADALLVVTPYYNKCTQQGLVKHYETIAQSTPLPIIVYNVPGRTGVNVSLNALKQMAQIDNIVAIKEASGNMDQVTEFCAALSDQIDIYSGEDSLTLPILSVGGKGVISVAANIIPNDMQKLCADYFAKEIQSAAQRQLKAYPLIKALFCEVNPIPVKTAVSLLGMCKPILRMPLTNMEDKTYAQLVGAMKDYGFNI